MVNLGIVPYVLSKFAFLAPLLTVLLIVMLAVLRLSAGCRQTDSTSTGSSSSRVTLTGLVGLALALLTSALVRTSQQATDMLSVWIMPQVLFGGALLAVPAMTSSGR